MGQRDFEPGYHFSEPSGSLSLGQNGLDLCEGLNYVPSSIHT